MVGEEACVYKHEEADCIVISYVMSLNPPKSINAFKLCPMTRHICIARVFLLEVEDNFADIHEEV